MLKQGTSSLTIDLLMRSLKKCFSPLDAKTQKLLQFLQSGFACLGVLALVFVLALFLSTSVRQSSQSLFVAWFLDDSKTPMQDGRNQNDSSDQQLSTDLTLADLSPDQVKATKWLSRRYSVAIGPIIPLVVEAWTLGPQMDVKPTLLLAVAAIESRFNPIAQSHFGAQGLMQVRTSVHEARYDEHGGLDAVFDPVINMRVGASILQEYIRRFGGIEQGLKAYVGAAYSGNHNGYADKVFGVQKRLDAIVGVEKESINTGSKSTAEPASKSK